LTKYPDNEDQVCFHITDEEWDQFPFESKILLLYRLKNSKHEGMKQLLDSVGQVIEHEKLEREIDYEATYKKIYGED